MTDPFAGLNTNNLQSMATANGQLNGQMMYRQPMAMSSAAPQLIPRSPQQPTGGQSPAALVMDNTNDMDERKKFEKHHKFQLQQKRLQEMSMSSGVAGGTTSAADQLMANIIQKVETDAKFDKRLHSRHSVNSQAYGTPSPAVMSGNQLSMISGASHTTAPFVPQYQPNLGPIGVNQQPVNNNANDMRLSQNSYQLSQQQQDIKSHTTSSYVGPQNQSLQSTPILQQLFVDNHRQDNNTGYGYTSNTYLPQTSAVSTHPQQSMTSSANTTGTTTANTRAQSVAPSPPVVSAVRKLPSCFEATSFQTPAIYSQVWHYVQSNDNLCDTGKLYPVLLSVGLPQQVLAQLWSVVNQTIPGQLTRQELSMALALIALVQKNSGNPLEEIYRLDSLPVPVIRFFDATNPINATSGTQSQQQQTSAQPHTQTPQIMDQIDDINTNTNDQKLSTFQTTTGDIPSKMSECRPDFSPNYDDLTAADDDFADFKSADFTPITNNASNHVIFGTEKQSLADKSVDIDEDFDDFKSATLNETTITQPVVPFEPKSKTHNLSDALMSNLTAISIGNSPQNLAPTPTPSFTISLANSSDTSGPNTLESSPDSIGVYEPIPTQASNGITGSSADKYRVFRELTTDTSATKSGDDFGNFLSHTSADLDAQSVDSLQFNANQDNLYESNDAISLQMIHTCRQLIHKAFNVLVVSHGEDSVLEAMRANTGHRFAFDLLEVYAIVKRLYKSLKASDKLNDNLVKLMDDIDNAWSTISSLFIKASIDVELKGQDMTVQELTNNDNMCTICSSKATTDCPVIAFAGYDYHTSCANLWLNCINSSLPQPLVNCR